MTFHDHEHVGEDDIKKLRRDQLGQVYDDNQDA